MSCATAYGATCGAIATLVIVAAVAAAGLPTIAALVLGLVTLLANGFATAAWRYICARSLAETMHDLLGTRGWPIGEVSARLQHFLARPHAVDRRCSCAD